MNFRVLVYVFDRKSRDKGRMLEENEEEVVVVSFTTRVLQSLLACQSNRLQL